MRFLNLGMTAPDIDDVKIEFGESVNVISVQDKKLFDHLKIFPLISLYGSQQEETGQEIFTAEIFVMSSYYSPEAKFNNIDPIFEKDKIKQLLINSEIAKLKFPYFTQREKLLAPKEKELINLEKEKQLLELKKVKNEKLLKEIKTSGKDVSNLEKKREAIFSYKSAIDEIIKLIDKRDNISSKINNVKKDIIELKEIQDKITSIENIISERFSHFSSKGGRELPDLELIQQSFNSFRDINEQIDNYFIGRKKLSVGAIRIIYSSVIFSLIALVFLFFTSSPSLILIFISSISAGIAFLGSLIYFFIIRRLNPTELLDKKNLMENNLLDILKKNDFPLDNYKTGELYEILFQYFDDYISFRDINNELISLKKKRSSSMNLAKKENELEQFMSEINELDEAINMTIGSLDASIHPPPAQEEIVRTVHNIDELLEENKIEIDKKNSLIAKFQEEIDEYNKDEKNLLSSEMSLEKTIEYINNLTEEIKHIKFLDGIFNEAVEKWAKDKLEELSNSALEKIMQIINNPDMREKLGECLKNILINSGELKEEYTEFKPYISFAIKAALSENLKSTPLPPMFMIDPFIPNNEFSENIKKLLPDFFPDRQVIVIISYNDPNINGNLIAL